MRSTQNKSNVTKYIKIILSVLIIALLIIGGFYIKNQLKTEKTVQTNEQSETEDEVTDQNNEAESEQDEEEKKDVIDITIAAAGDIMFHDSQLESAYDKASDSYDFTSVFADVAPIFSEADLALANFETTTAGPNDGEGYRGYPTFNSPDETIDAIKASGIDVLTTANNHSLDTGSEGLKRTVEVIRDKGLTSVGTYDEKPESRVHIEEVEGIKIAILSYTEMINDLGLQTTNDNLDDMINIMEKNTIKEDIAEAKDLQADVIISFVHWGEEYIEDLSPSQVEFADLMTEEGVDIILGSHPHVIQQSGFLQIEDQQSYVIYSMGNFVSNQRDETIDNPLAEDGVIVNLDIQKNTATNETTIEKVEHIPTWVYRNKEDGESTYTYRILPIEQFLDSSEIPNIFKERMENSLEATSSKMSEDVLEKE